MEDPGTGTFDLDTPMFFLLPSGNCSQGLFEVHPSSMLKVRLQNTGLWRTHIARFPGTQGLNQGWESSPTGAGAHEPQRPLLGTQTGLLLGFTQAPKDEGPHVTSILLTRSEDRRFERQNPGLTNVFSEP